MKLGLQIGVPGKKRAGKALAAAAEEAAGAWRAGKKEETVALLNEIFDAGVPWTEWLAPYAKEFGAEYRDLVSKLYLLHFDPKDEEWEWGLAEFEEACGGGLVTGFASRLAGEKWEEVREKFYEKCPGCMFMGETAEPYSLKLRSENCIECIPEDDCDLHELASPADDYGHTMDGYSLFEGYALVRDDPGAKKKYPPGIKAVLEKIKARKLKYFPNVIFPLVEGKDLFDSCNQMLELLQLLDYGYRFESVSRYITAHPELFPEIVKKRLKMFEDPDDDDDPEFEEELEEEETVSGPEAEETSEVPAAPETPGTVEPPPELDLKRIAEDEARGIRFSADKRVFEKYPEKLRTASYEIPRGVIAVKESAFRDCKNLKSVTIPEGVMFIGKGAFSRCGKLANVTIPKSVLRIGRDAFWSCESLNETVIPEGITEIGESTFGGCENLSSVVIPESTLVIGDKAFKKCAKLTDVVIPANVRFIGEEAFAECPCEPELKKKYPHLFPDFRQG